MKLRDIDAIAIALARASDDLAKLDTDAIAYIRETLVEAKASIDRALERVKEAA